MKTVLPAWLIALILALVITAAQAAPAEKLLLGAGPIPSDARASAAILKSLQATERGRSLDRKKPFRVLSGPTLATGNTFGGSLEQAWLMCIVLNAEKISPGPRQLEGRPVYLRSRGREVVVVPAENWQDSSPKC